MALAAQSINEHCDILFTGGEGNHLPFKNNLASVFDGESFFHEPTAFYYNDRTRLQFRVKDEFATHFVLIKGLVEFTRPATLKFKFTVIDGLIETDVDVNQFDELKSLLNLVFNELWKELKFKASLKKAIQFEERYKLERAEVYSTILH